MTALIKQDSPAIRRYLQYPRYLQGIGLSANAKQIYVLLLERLRASQKNGWVNKNGEVFLIYPREELSRAAEVNEKTVTRSMRELRQKDLIQEVRQGMGRPNLIFLVQKESKSPKKVPPQETEPAAPSPKNVPRQETEPAPYEPQKVQGSHNHISQNQNSDLHISQTNRVREIDGGTEEEEKLHSILEGCDLDIFPAEEQEVLRAAVERLFYSESFRLGDATLPKSSIRAWLSKLDAVVLQDVLGRLRQNRKNVKNPFGYVMTVLLNCIIEGRSELLVDPYLNGQQPWEDSLRSPGR